MAGALKKCVHTQLLTDTHSYLRIELFKRKLSLQEAFEEFAQLVASQDARVIRVLDDLQQKKRDKLIYKLSRTDAESLYEVINEMSPLTKVDEDED